MRGEARVTQRGCTTPCRVCELIRHKVFIKSFCKSQFPHKSVDLSFILVIIQDKLTSLCGNRLLQNNFINTCCEIRAVRVVARSARTPPTVERRERYLELLFFLLQYSQADTKVHEPYIRARLGTWSCMVNSCSSKRPPRTLQ